MNDLIQYNSEQMTFHLSNKQISYIFSIDEHGLLNQLYFGKAIKNYNNLQNYPKRDRGFSGNLPGVIDRTYSPDTILREYSSNGDGDYRTPACSIVQKNGSKATHFTYSHYKIVDGKPQLEGLPAAYVLDASEAQTLIVTLLDKVSNVSIDLMYSIYRDRSVITRSTQINNNNNEPCIYILKNASMQLDFPNESYDVISFPGAHNKERQIQRETIRYGVKKYSSRRGATSHQMNNSIVITYPTSTEHQGEVYGFNLVYSGNHAIEIEKDPIGQLRLTIGINEDNFTWKLAPSDIFQSPEVAMVYSDNGFNGMSKIYHNLIKDRIVRSSYQYKDRPILVNNWEATYFDFNDRKLEKIVDEASALGIEMFVLDDGWFGHRDNDTSSLGDWFTDTRKFPNGLNKFAKYVHSKKLLFGLWLEPEMISIDSDLFKKHPDYRLELPNREPSPSRSQYVLDLGRHEVREAVLQQLHELLNQGFVDYIKWDMNRHISDIFSIELPCDRQGEVLHRYILGLYKMLEELVTTYPNILWESCSGGGGRMDTGLAYYMPQTWTSDNTDAIARLKIQYGTSFFYPTSLFTSHISAIPNHQTGRITSLKMREDVAMSSVFGYEFDLTTLSEFEKEQVKQQTTDYKEIRHLVQYGEFIRLKSPFDNNECTWMFVDEDKTECLVFNFQVLNDAQPEPRLIKLQGLNPNKTYINYDTQKEFGGDELMYSGFYQEIAKNDFESTRYYFKAIN